MSPVHALTHILLVLALLIVALIIVLTQRQITALRAQVRQDRAAYIQQERNDRQALSAAASQISRAARRDIRNLCGRIPAR